LRTGGFEVHTMSDRSFSARWHSSLSALLLCVVTAAALANPVEVAGTVRHVTDGDSLWLKPADGGPALELRLEGIDAPELCQPGGPQSRQALVDVVLNQAVTARISGRDNHGRSLATVMLGDVNINRLQVMEGQAWSYRYKSDRGPYMGPERVAIFLKRGLHASSGAMMPREFRQTHGPCQVPAASAPGF
jgi:endonuclease YncB( thermonuclease family)